MTYLRHQYTVAFVLLLLTEICWQSSGAFLVQRPDGSSRRNIPTCHCCHAKVFLNLDRRFDLKPVFLLPSRVICLGDPVMRPVFSYQVFLCTLPTRTHAATRWRGPPAIVPSC